MTVPEMHRRVTFLLDRINSYQADTLLTSEIDRALNIAQEDFVKQRYGRANKYGKGFEENQKRIDDLSNLIRVQSLNTQYGSELWPDPNYITYVDKFAMPGTFPATDEFLQPITYMHLLNVEAIIWYKDCGTPLVEGVDYLLGSDQWNNNTINGSFRKPGSSNEEGDNNFLSSTLKQRRAVGKFIQHDDLNTALKDPFNKTRNSGFLYNIGIFTDFQGVARKVLQLYTDDTFFTDTVKVTYLKQPRQIEFYNAELESDVPCELSDHTHGEICKAAVDVLLESISDPRYKTHQIETMKSD